ncbi:MAG: amidohydrolase family protein [Promethearchaeota archaeon]
MIDGYEIFDAHMHYVGRFMEKGQTFIEYMDANGIDAAVLNTINNLVNSKKIAGASPEEFIKRIDDPKFELFEEFRLNGQPSHEIVRELAKKHPKRIYPFFWYNPNDPNDPTQEKGLELVRDTFNEGFKGVKLQLSMTPIFNGIEQLYPVAKLLVEFNLPLYIHSSPGIFMAKRTNPFEILKLAKKFPDLKIILGHSASSMEFCVQTMIAARSAPNIYFETSVSALYGIITYFKMYGAERVIFGTDSPTTSKFDIEYMKIKAIRATREEKELILSKNIKRLINI